MQVCYWPPLRASRSMRSPLSKRMRTNWRPRDLTGAEALRNRARRMYLRARELRTRAVWRSNISGMSNALLANPKAVRDGGSKTRGALALYWTEPRRGPPPSSLAKDNHPTWSVRFPPWKP